MPDLDFVGFDDSSAEEFEEAAALALMPRRRRAKATEEEEEEEVGFEEDDDGEEATTAPSECGDGDAKETRRAAKAAVMCLLRVLSVRVSRCEIMRCLGSVEGERGEERRGEGGACPTRF